jgi:hypothetical protein
MVHGELGCNEKQQGLVVSRKPEAQHERAGQCTGPKEDNGCRCADCWYKGLCAAGWVGCHGQSALAQARLGRAPSKQGKVPRVGMFPQNPTAYDKRKLPALPSPHSPCVAAP